MNPSSADDQFDDRTCRRELDFSQQWGYNAYLKGNILDWVETNPDLLPADCNVARSELNLPAIRAMAEQAEGALWKRLTGYHVRSRVKAQMLRLKAFGERIASRDPDRQTAEFHTRIALMNRFSALGQAEIVRVAYIHGDRGNSAFNPRYATTPLRGLCIPF
jgi:hypothetical protein